MDWHTPKLRACVTYKGRTHLDTVQKDKLNRYALVGQDGQENQHKPTIMGRIVMD